MASGALPVIYVSGSNHDIGLQIGKTFRSLIRTAVQANKSLRNTLLPYYGTNEGDKVYAEYLKVAEEWLPHYMDELRGIAEGSHVPFHHLFLLHIEPEIVVLATKGAADSGGCTTVQLLTDDVAVIAHTEDGGREWRDYGYVVHAHITPTERNGYTEERFVSFCYPGMLVGNAYAVNKHGLAIAGNYVKPNKIYTKGRIARRILSRAVIAAKSMKNVKEIIKELPGIGAGFHFNMGQKERGKKRSHTKSRKTKTVPAPVAKETEAYEDKTEKPDEKDESSDSSSSHGEERKSGDSAEEAGEPFTEFQDVVGKNQDADFATGEVKEKAEYQVDDTEEDVRVEMLERVNEAIEDAEYSQNEIEPKNLEELEELIKKYLVHDTETVSRKFVQEVERIYTYRSFDEPVVEETIQPQVAYPLETVCRGTYDDAFDKKSDSGSSSDSDSSEDGASNKQKKSKKKSAGSSDEEDDKKESEKSDSEDEFEEAVEKHDSEHEHEDAKRDQETGDGEEIVEEHVTVTKQETDGGTEVITEKRVTVVKTEVVGDIDPEEKERIIQEMKEKLAEERQKITGKSDSDSGSDTEKEKKRSESSASETDLEKKEDETPTDELVEENVTVTRLDTDDGKTEVITEKRVTVVKTEVVGDIDPEEKERIIQEMKGKLAEERKKIMGKSGSESESDHDEDKKRKSESSGSESDSEKKEGGEATGEIVEEKVTVTKHDTVGGDTETITEERITVVKTEVVGDIDPEEKERIIQEMKEKLEEERQKIAGKSGSESESDHETREEATEECGVKPRDNKEEKEQKSESSDSESDTEKKELEEGETKQQIGEEVETKRESESSASGSDSETEKNQEKADEPVDEVLQEQVILTKQKAPEDSTSGPESEEEGQQRKQSESSESDVNEDVKVNEEVPEQEIVEEHVTVTKQETDGGTEVITEKRVTVVKTEVVGDIDPEEKERIIQEMKEKLEEERQKIAGKNGSESESDHEIEDQRKAHSETDSEKKELPETEESTEKVAEILSRRKSGGSDSHSDSDHEEKKAKSSDSESESEIITEANVVDSTVAREDVREEQKKESSDSESDEEKKGKRKSIDSGSDADFKEEIMEKFSEVMTFQRSHSDSESDKESKEKASSDSDSDDEKKQEENNNVKVDQESEKEDAPVQEQPEASQTREEEHRGEETEEKIAVEVIREVPVQQYATPPREEKEEIEKSESESESESESDFSDLEEGETRIRFGSLEVAGDENGTVIDEEKISGFYCHTNQYLRLDRGYKGDFVEKNSQAREDRVMELTSEGNPKTIDDVLTIMGDTTNTRFPIWRDGKYPDLWATLSLGVFNFKSEELMIFRSNPRTNPTYAAFQFPK